MKTKIIAVRVDKFLVKYVQNCLLLIVFDKIIMCQIRLIKKIKLKLLFSTLPDETLYSLIKINFSLQPNQYHSTSDS